MPRKNEKTQTFKTDAGITFLAHIFNEGPFEQFQNRDVETNGRNSVKLWDINVKILRFCRIYEAGAEC